MSRCNRDLTSYAAKYPALARRRRASPATNATDFASVVLGHDPDGMPVRLDERIRLEMMHVIGATGSGKTTFLKNLALQDFRRGRGGLVIDPHGGHDGSLYAELVAELERDGFFETGRVHLLDPNVRDYVVPFNFLAPIADTDISVVADALLQAVERVWADENTLQKPTIRSNLKAAFMALAELGMPLGDARLLFDPQDRHGVRARAIERLSNEYAREELQRLHRIALADRTQREFNLEVRGPINRLNEFVSSDVMRAMLGIVDTPGEPRRTFDLLAAMDRGDIILCNLGHGGAVSEADADLIGALLLRYLLLLAARRSNREPFMLIADECHRYLSGDVPNILAECRKWGIAGHFAHQFMAQLGKPDDLLYRALLDCVEIHVVFRLKSPAEAQLLAEHVLPLTLERPVKASIRPTAIGHRRVRLSSRSAAQSRAETIGSAETETQMTSVTVSHGRSDGVGSSTATTTSDGTFDGTGASSGMTMTPPWVLFGPNHPTASFVPTALAQTKGSATSQGRAHQSGTTQTTSHSTVETVGEARSEGHSRAHSTSHSSSIGATETTGTSEAFETLYADLPASFHSKTHELYFAGELIRALPVGRAFVSWRGTTRLVTIPPSRRSS